MTIDPDIPITTEAGSGASLLGLARDLTSDGDAKAEFRADPEGFLANRGLDGLDAGDLTTAWTHVADALPAPLAVAFSDAANSGGDVVEQLLGLVDIDPIDAEATWAALTEGDIDEVDEITGAEDDLDEPGGLDPVENDGDLDLDEPGDDVDEPGGLDPVDLDRDLERDLDGEPGGLDPVRSAQSDDDFDRDDLAPDRDDAFGSGTRGLIGDRFGADDLDEASGKDFDRDDLAKRFDDLDDDLAASFDLDTTEPSEGFELGIDEPDVDDGSSDPDDLDL